jgi:hypothetical protein
MAETFFRTAVLDDRETEIEVEIKVHSWGCAAQTYGPPENCYPAEGAEVEIIDAWLLEEANLPNTPSILASLTDAERERIETEFCENPPEPDYGDDY